MLKSCSHFTGQSIQSPDLGGSLQLFLLLPHMETNVQLFAEDI